MQLTIFYNVKLYIIISLEGSLVYMKHKFKHIKKSSSGTSLVDMVPEDDEI